MWGSCWTVASKQRLVAVRISDVALPTYVTTSGRKSCSGRKHQLSSSMVVISLCRVLRAVILKPVIDLGTVTGSWRLHVTF